MTHQNLTTFDLTNIIKFVCIGAPLTQAVEVAIALGVEDTPEGFLALAERIENEAPGLTSEDIFNTAIYGVRSPCIEWRWVRSVMEYDGPSGPEGDPVDSETVRPFREGVWRLSHFLTFLKNTGAATFTGFLQIPEGVQ